MDSVLVSFICCAVVVVGFTSSSGNAHSPDISSGTYVGCFRDIGQYATFARKFNATQRDPVSCRERCGHEGFTYIGLWGGGICWCASNLYERTTPNRTGGSGLLEKVNDSQCSASCIDNSTFSCGGFKDEAGIDIYSVYSVCPKTRFSTQCSFTCNCKDGSHCNINGVCSNNECAPGWKMNATNNRNICNNDVDECWTNNGNCNHTCTNTNGSYSCSCFSGYQLHSDKHTCEDINECTKNNGNCSQECSNSIGSYECKCDEGYELESDLHSCKDVDECSRNLSECNQNCTNTIGSYGCSCFSGFKLRDEHLCIDIDECWTNNGNCSQLCSNTNVSYVCSCQRGYQLHNDSHTCEDVNECSRNLSECNQNCTNTIGSYNCSCFPGFKLRDEHICVDVDECEMDNGGCQQYCNNTHGSYICSYQPGFGSTVGTNDTGMNETIYNNTDIVESSESPLNCDDSCNNTLGNYTCGSHSGSQLQDNEFNCNVVEEADLESTSLELLIGSIAASSELFLEDHSIGTSQCVDVFP